MRTTKNRQQIHMTQHTQILLNMKWNQVEFMCWLNLFVMLYRLGCMQGSDTDRLNREKLHGETKALQ